MSERKKQEITAVFPIIVLFLCMVSVSVLYSHTYRQIAFEHISAFCEIMIEADSKLEQQVLSAVKEYNFLTEEEVDGNLYLTKYGYHINEFCKGLSLTGYIFFLFLFSVITSVFLFSVSSIKKWNQKRIDELTDYLEQVNLGISGTMIQIQEDDLSRLQDEIYKTVTTLYQTREAAIAAKKRFAKHLENIAHQLKTPITAAFLSLQLMKETASNHYATQMEKQLERLNYLEEALLNLSKIDSGILPLKYIEVDIYTALTLAAENLNDLLIKENISVLIPDRGCIEFLGDLEWTMEALMNLMKNCMEHSPSGGKIHCDYTGNPLYVEILIWDEGEGFDSEDIPHLFERFYRGKRASGNGIGIGLALSRSIFELQNGTITAQNLQDGGACFKIRLYRH